MVQFATAFSQEAILLTLSRQLSWLRFVSLLPLKAVAIATAFTSLILPPSPQPSPASGRGSTQAEVGSPEANEGTDSLLAAAGLLPSPACGRGAGERAGASTK
ncbi:hypothetical protein [Cupriavidus sp. H39]|uniref:hypothetical protein n=1 Tax=Cupriavidus sp. H39 TaxID=3401635 RepID=UPI003D05921B